MAEPQLGTEHLLPFEKGGDGPASAEQGLADLLASNPELGGEAPTESDGARPTVEAEAATDDESEEEAQAPDADEVDESEGDKEQDEVEPEPDPEAQKHKFRADGQDFEVSYDELLRHASAGVHMTRGTMALADDRRAFESERQQKRDEWGQRMATVEQLITQLQPPEPDWDTLRKENPGEYAALKVEHDERKAALEFAKAEQEAARQERYTEWLTAEQAKLDALVPEWKDKAKASTEKAAVIEYATKTYGWTPEVLGEASAAVVDAIRKAMLYDEIKARGAKVQEKAKAVPVLKPGAPTNKAQSGPKAEQRKALNRHSQVKNASSAAAALMGLLPD